MHHRVRGTIRKEAAPKNRDLPAGTPVAYAAKLERHEHLGTVRSRTAAGAKRCAAVSISVLVAAVLLVPNARAVEGQTNRLYWLSGEDVVTVKDKNRTGPADYLDLWHPGAPWASAAAKLTGFKVSTQLVLRGTDEQLRTVIDGLRARNVGMSIELGLLTYTDAPPSCGKGAEGYSREPGPGRVSAVQRVTDRLAAFGGKLDSTEMDEPVTWGFSRTGTTRAGYPFCHQPIDALVDRMAPQVAILQHAFPKMQFGLVDSVNGRWPDLPQGILSLVDTMDGKLHVKIGFVHADVAWDSDWLPGLRVLAQGLRLRGVRFGVICDGPVQAASDEAWTAIALKRCRDIANDPSLRPDDFLVQSWSAQPHAYLPETDPGTSTWLLKQVEAIP